MAKILRPGGALLLAALLWAMPAWAGEVMEANSGRPGETMEVKSLAKRGRVTLVDFYSPYCAPCVRLAPLLAQLAQRRPDLTVQKLNINRPQVRGIDWQSPLARQYDLRSVPHFMIFDAKGRLKAEGKTAANQVFAWLKEAGLL